MTRKKAKYDPQPWEHDRTFKNINGNLDNGYLRTYRSMLYSPVIRHISGEGFKLYSILKDQYRNRPEQINGTVKCPYKFLLNNGFKSRETISRHLQELQEFGLIEIKVKGGFGVPNEYILSDKWKAIKEEDISEIKKRLKAT